MTTALTPFHDSLPDFLKDPALFDLADDVAGGIVGSQPPSISIKAAKWRLVDGGGEEELVNQLHLDVVVLGANPNVSKIYYAGKYDPTSGEAMPPDCFSDNGIGPSSRSSSPQASTCAGCSHNVWGSRISELSGKKVKECSDSKKIAVVLARPTPTMKGGLAGEVKPGDQVYMLRVPATSMAKLRDLAMKAKQAGVPLLGCILRLTFNAEASYPQIEFGGNGYVDEALFHKARRLVDSVEVKTATGGDDKPYAGTPTLTAAASDGGTTFEPPPAYLSGATSGGAGEAAPAASATPSDAPRKRGRPKATDSEAKSEAKLDGKSSPAVVMEPPPSDAALDSLLGSILK